MKQLGHFVDKRILSGCQHDRNIAIARDALREGKGRAGEFGQNITRNEALRRLVNPEQVKSLSTHNVMSPDLISIRAMAGNGAGPLVVEVSAGEFMGDTLYGITVYHILPGERDRDFDASTACHSLEETLATLRALNGGDE